MPEQVSRLDEPGTFVVDFEPGLHGPFTTRRAAQEWARKQIDEHGDPARTYSFVVAPVRGSDETPKEMAR